MEVENKSFEATFNEWYKKFLEEEKKFNTQLKDAKIFREQQITRMRKEVEDELKEMDSKAEKQYESEKSKVDKYTY